MPLYEYQCETCGSVFEKIQKFSDDPLTVHENCGGAVHRLLTAPALQFKGTGWYITDYGRGGNKPSGANGENKSGSEAKGESHGKNDSSSKGESGSKGDSSTKSGDSSTKSGDSSSKSGSSSKSDSSTTSSSSKSDK
jgi:putative FmdB family regulatory protein